MNTTVIDNRPTAMHCEVAGCLVLDGTHDPRDVTDNYVHDLAPLDGHGFDVSPVRKGAEEWRAWVELSTSERLMSAVELREFSIALAHEATRIDALNDGGLSVTRGGQLVHPDSLLMDALCSADIASRAVTRSRYSIKAGAQS
ncbi:hypothetical protein E3O47_00345 [Cryobacterium sp. TMT2-17-1]|uniref:hypothetical protein n=1 Tax=Cryobacterium sp. TMT2-17-1 TaxID=1259248 RepID=UPI00106C105D|nr:hypothetical protein [Cryobacterium sp. TMT2-17-1]TFC55363.1 hypothetical protein E3O47_00345 [Cryobacterium sp. TMT2-17-1]